METELKLAFPSEEELDSCFASNALRELFTVLEEKSEEYENVYLDTEARVLHKSRTSLRVRHVNGQDYIHTVKTSPVVLEGEMTEEVRAGLSSRCEWNVPSDSAEFDPARFLSEAASGEDPIDLLEMALRPIVEKRLQIVCSTVFTRRILVVQFRESQMEVCFDVGECQGNGRSLPICEMEIELIVGKTEDVETLGTIITSRFPCRGGSLSKYARCLLLMNEERV